MLHFVIKGYIVVYVANICSWFGKTKKFD